MSDRESLQRDALNELVIYSNHLIPALQTIIKELREDVHADTNAFLGEVINGINWEIEVYNQCAGLINEKGNYIDKKAMITAVTNLGKTLQSNDSSKIADCLEEDFLPFLNQLALASQMVLQ
ncbi:MAG: hypothetical protein Q4D51_05220 [Eubacteriales bacterium]|nr:hypothetical protein [Eubacteriales bacterium]